MCNYKTHLPALQLPALLLSLLPGLFWASGSSAEGAPDTRALTIVVKDIRLPDKPLYLAVYDGNAREGWEAEPLKQISHRLPQDDTLTLSLDLPGGRYAVRAFVDTTDSGELDTRSFDRPREPFAISLGDGRERPSRRFSESVFTLDESGDTIHLLLHYPRGSDNNTP